MQKQIDALLVIFCSMPFVVVVVGRVTIEVTCTLEENPHIS